MIDLDDRFTEAILTTPETGRHLDVAEDAVRRWARAESQLIHVVKPRADRATVPFMAAVETQVLRGLKQLGVPPQELRESVERLRREFGPWALVNKQFALEGKNLLVNLANESPSPAWERARDGQVGIPEVIDNHIKYLHYDPDGYAERLRLRSYENFGTDVILDLRFGSGEPVFSHSKVRVRDVTDAFYAGESPDDIAYDYGIDVHDVFAAVLSERKPPTRKYIERITNQRAHVEALWDEPGPWLAKIYTDRVEITWRPD